MAWIRGGLSQFTDQISTFTKEVLTETTEEIEDPAAELLVARKKIEELQEKIDRFQNEWEKLQKHSAEVTERADTAEYQIATISQEYRKLLQGKETELRRLQTENQSLREQNKGLATPDGSGLVHSPLKDLVSSERLFGGGPNTELAGGGALMWGEDLSEIINSQSEINQLRSELAKQAAESRHWKQVAKENQSTNSTQPTQPADDSLLLRQKIEELQQCVQQEVLSRERELSALQATHTDSIHTLTQKHRLQVELLQQQAQELKDKLTAVEATDSGMVDQQSQVAAYNGQQVEHLVQEKERLTLQLGDMQSCIAQHQDSISRLQTGHAKSQREVEQLSSQVEQLAREVEVKELEICSMRDGELNTSLRETDVARLALEQETVALKEMEKARAALEQENKTLKDAEIASRKAFEDKEKESTLLAALRRDLDVEQHTSVELKTSNERLAQKITELNSEVNRLATDKKHLESQLKQVQGSHRSLQSEVEGQLQLKQAECSKYGNELTRLRAHLLQVEDQYTKEALRSDEREAGLRRQLADLQDKLRWASSTGTSQSQEMRGRMEALESELKLAVEQRDDALQQMSNAQEQAQQNATALLNLQSVLEQFQRDQSSELSQALKRSQTELADTLQHCQQLRQEQALTQSKLHEATMAAKAAATLTVELEEREKNIKLLEDQVTKLDSSLDESKAAIDKLSADDSTKVDRKLVKNLVLGYVHATTGKKTEVLRLISKILEFSSQELDSATGRRSGWLSGLWRGPPPSPSASADGSFSQLFVKFLESESLASSSRSTPLQSPGYIDPKTDPDRPSLATVLPSPVVRPAANPSPSSSPPSSNSNSVHTPPGPRLNLTVASTPQLPVPHTAVTSNREPLTANREPLVALSSSKALQSLQRAKPSVDASSSLSTAGGDQKLSSLFAFSPAAVPARPRQDDVKLTNHSFQSSLLNSVLSD